MVWVGVFCAVAVASAASTLSGFGFALIATPLVAILVGPRPAVVGLSIVGIVLASQLWLRGRRSVDRGAVATIFVAALLGMPLGVLVLANASEDVLTALIGIAVIVFGLLLWRGVRVPAGPATEATAGFVGGVLSTSTGTNGPPIVIALASKDPTPTAFRSTISAIFLLQGCLAVVAFLLLRQVDREAISVAMAGLPGVILGLLVGERGFRSLEPHAFRRVVLAMLLASGVLALAGSLVR